jgi:membrane-associated phospholipid phosphatase
VRVRAKLGPVIRLWRWSNGLLPQGWFDAIRQLALFAGAYYAYRIVRGVVDGEAALAYDNARTLIDAERTTHTFFEADFQAWALSHAHWLVDFGNWMYINSHFVVTVTFLVWLYLARNHAFYFVRNMFMVAMGLALVGYVVFPTAPPRFMPEWGFTDTVSAAVGENAAKGVSTLYNPFAAVPSMHVAFALMIALPAMRLVRWRALKVAWSLYPGIVTLVVVVTGNHWWLDAALGALVAAVAAVAATFALARARPAVWAWRAVPAEAPA